MTTKATRQQRKAAQARLRDAKRDAQYWRFRWAQADDPVSKATFARGVQAARSRQAEAERQLGFP